MYKFDFFDFTAPLVSGEMPLLGDMGFEPLSFDIRVQAAKIENNAVQALPNGDDYAGDMSSTARLTEESNSIFLSHDGIDSNGDKDWVGVQLTAGDVATFNLERIGGGGSMDIVLLDGTIDYTLIDRPFLVEATGLYFVQVQFFGSSSMDDDGARLSFSVTQDDYTSDVTTTGVITVGDGPLNFLSEVPWDKDWARLEGYDINDLIHIERLGIPSSFVLVDSEGDPVNPYGSYDRFLLTSSEPYYLAVDHSFRTGEVSFDITKIDNIEPGTLQNPLSVEVGEPAIDIPAGVVGELFYINVEDFTFGDTVEINFSDGRDLVLYFNSEFDPHFAQGEDNGLAEFVIGDGISVDWSSFEREVTFSFDWDFEGGSPITVESNVIAGEIAANYLSTTVISTDGSVLSLANDFSGDSDWLQIDFEADATYRVSTVDGSQLNAEVFKIEEFFDTLVTPVDFDSETGVFSTSGIYGTFGILVHHGDAAEINMRIEEVLEGTDGADSLFIRNKVVTLDAGAGDDLVNAGLGNAPSVYFSGGDGFDTLYLHVETYQKFDFRAAEFEVAILREVDGTILGRYSQNGTQDIHTEYDARDDYSWSRRVIIEDTEADAPYARKELVYNDAGVLSREKVLNQDSSFTDIQYDAENAYSFEMREFKYTAEGGDLVSIETLYDSGRQNIVTYDVDNAEIFWSLKSETIDVDDSQAWESSTSYYEDFDGFLARTRLVIEYDNGTTSDFEYILFGQNAGNTVQTLTDGGDLHGWDSWVITKNNSGETIESVRSNDNGVVHSLFYNPDAIEGTATRAVNEDAADIFNWTSTERRLDSDGNTLSLEIDYDEGFTVFTEYDVAGENPWARIVTQIDVDGTEDWDSRSFYYDAEGVLYDTVYV